MCVCCRRTPPFNEVDVGWQGGCYRRVWLQRHHIHVSSTFSYVQECLLSTKSATLGEEDIVLGSDANIAARPTHLSEEPGV